jgi:DNA-binding CsgD family transcriptional regulator/PAS domain-containing protein
MDLDQCARQLVELCYEAALEPPRWGEFIRALSAAYGHIPAGMGFTRPGDPLAGTIHRVGLQEHYAARYGEHFLGGLPWSTRYAQDAGKDFGVLARYFAPDLELSKSGFYNNWMKPQGLAAVWPIGASLRLDGIGSVGWISIYKREGGDPFNDDDVAFGNEIFPHLQRAMRIHSRLLGARQERMALAEVMDRLPTGVVLLDPQHQPVSTNHAADRILAMGDGIALGANGPFASDPRENCALQKLLSSALTPDPGKEIEAGGFIAVSRPSGRRAYAVMVTPLLAAPADSTSGDAVLSMWIADPESGKVSATEVLEHLYQLTTAEAELVQLLSQGFSLDEAAQRRGVTINTARSQLKQVFSKTDTRRQGELMRLVLTGVASIRDSEPLASLPRKKSDFSD